MPRPKKKKQVNMYFITIKNSYFGGLIINNDNKIFAMKSTHIDFAKLYKNVKKAMGEYKFLTTKYSDVILNEAPFDEDYVNSYHLNQYDDSHIDRIFEYSHKSKLDLSEKEADELVDSSIDIFPIYKGF